MDWIAQVIFATAAVITALTGLVSAVGVFLNLRATKAGAAISASNGAALSTVISKTDGVLTRLETRATNAEAKVDVARQETADARVAGAEGAGLARAGGVEQERVRNAGGQPST